MIGSFAHQCNSKRINVTAEVSSLLILFLTAITAIGGCLRQNEFLIQNIERQKPS